MVRVRFAPSPTGYLHVGGARTALFNWLYARRHQGTFVLRIEDTDAERSSWDMVTGIVDGLRWLGLDWDEGPDVGGPHAPYFQSERLEEYRAAAQELLGSGAAYRCFCSAELLQQKRAAAEAAGGGWIYDRACCAMSEGDVAAKLAAGEPFAIRCKVPPGTTSFHDQVHGTIEFDNANIEDFVILRSDRQPTYHLSVVVDDIDMAITHVVRGDDHISNTPKQVILYQALGRPVPAFAHVPLILGPDKKRLSKRHGATSVMEYHRTGYLAEAMVNFLALLGWSPGTDEELFTKDELIRRFALEGISGGNAVFNPDKLDWFNQQHIQRLQAGEIATRLRPFLEAEGLWREDYGNGGRDWLLSVIDLYKPRLKKLEQFAVDAQPLLADVITPDPDAVKKHLARPELLAPLAELARRFEGLEPFTSDTTETVLREVADSHQLKAALLIHATRVAVTGRANSPGLFEVLSLVGRQRVVNRIRAAEPFLLPTSSTTRANG